jgi:hypothetical protein
MFVGVLVESESRGAVKTIAHSRQRSQKIIKYVLGDLGASLLAPVASRTEVQPGVDPRICDLGGAINVEAAPVVVACDAGYSG